MLLTLGEGTTEKVCMAQGTTSLVFGIQLYINLKVL